MQFDLNYKSLATVLVWALIVTGACYYFYDQEVKVGQTLPVLMAAQSMDATELSYIYEADISDLYNTGKVDEDNLNNSVTIYMYEDKKKSEWGRIFIFDRATSSFRYLIKTNSGNKIEGQAIYNDNTKTYMNTDNTINVTNSATSSVQNCSISIVVKSADKVVYTIKNIPNDRDSKCDKYGTSTGSHIFLPNVIHKLI